MSEPLPLPGLEPATNSASSVILTPRQAYALEVISEHGPIQSVDLGAHLHEYRRRNGGRGHASDELCEFCQGEGADVGAALQRKGLVKRRRGEGWVVASWTPWSRKPSSQMGPDDDWPEGF